MSRPDTKRWSNEQWTRREEPTRRAVNATEKLMWFGSGIASAVVYLNWDAIVAATIAAVFA